MKYMLTLIMLILSVVSVGNINKTPTTLLIKKESVDVACVVEELYDRDTLANILGYLESRNNYKAVHRITGTMGKYQFRIQTLQMLGIYCTRKQFLEDSCLQEHAFDRLVAYQYRFLLNSGMLNKVGQKTIDGIPINTENLIIASHLCGPVSVYDYIINGNRHNRMIKWNGMSVYVFKSDLNGTTIQSYMKQYVE